jgi:hypothetical protein
VRPEGVASAKSPSEGGMRFDWSVMAVDLGRIRYALTCSTVLVIFQKTYCLWSMNSRYVLRHLFEIELVLCIYSPL